MSLRLRRCRELECMFRKRIEVWVTNPDHHRFKSIKQDLCQILNNICECWVSLEIIIEIFSYLTVRVEDCLMAVHRSNICIPSLWTLWYIHMNNNILEREKQRSVKEFPINGNVFDLWSVVGRVPLWHGTLGLIPTQIPTCIIKMLGPICLVKYEGSSLKEC